MPAYEKPPARLVDVYFVQRKMCLSIQIAKELHEKVSKKKKSYTKTKKCIDKSVQTCISWNIQVCTTKTILTVRTDVKKGRGTVQELKKTFTRPEAEVVKFEKTDVIATSTQIVHGTGQPGTGSLDDEGIG